MRGSKFSFQAISFFCDCLLPFLRLFFNSFAGFFFSQSYSANWLFIYLLMADEFYLLFCQLISLNKAISSRYDFISLITLGIKGGLSYFFYKRDHFISAKNLCSLISWIPLCPSLSQDDFLSNLLMRSAKEDDQPQGRSASFNRISFLAIYYLIQALFLPSQGLLPKHSS